MANEAPTKRKATLTIEPCPMCNGHACIYPHRNTKRHITTFDVMCSVCHLMTPTYTSREAARRAWNMRVKTPR